MSDSLQPCGLQATRLLCPWDSPGKNTGVVCHALLQGIFATWGLNVRLFCLLNWQGVLYQEKPNNDYVKCKFSKTEAAGWGRNILSLIMSSASLKELLATQSCLLYLGQNAVDTTH